MISQHFKIILSTRNSNYLKVNSVHLNEFNQLIIISILWIIYILENEIPSLAPYPFYRVHLKWQFCILASRGGRNKICPQSKFLGQVQNPQCEQDYSLTGTNFGNQMSHSIPSIYDRRMQMSNMKNNYYVHGGLYNKLTDCSRSRNSSDLPTCSPEIAKFTDFLMVSRESNRVA